MSLQSDAANRHIEGLLLQAYPLFGAYRKEFLFVSPCPEKNRYKHELYCMTNKKQCSFFDECRHQKWRFDFAVPSVLCAKSWGFHVSHSPYNTYPGRAIELDGGTFQSTRTGHASGVGLRNWRDKNNAAMSAGWRVWHYAPEEVIKAGRKVRIRSEFVQSGLIPESMNFISRPILGYGEGIRNPAR